ncbi:MAG TPA: aminotransferase class V-fold PLP-dependent enzyme, partial [Micromonosporaceae bacterium]|nr:aminotransferase class V-fold PLP-dependent enzyme [Micromonosporaceae bacterium]
PGEIAGRLPAGAPGDGESFDRILADLDSAVLPGITHWQHPSFFGYFPANTSGPSVLADLISSGFGVQGMLWTTSPACTELETVMLDWLVDLLGLPKRFRSDTSGGGVIQDTASSAALVATLTALHRASGGTWGRAGVRGRHLVYTSSQAHSSIEKAARIAGIGDSNVRLIDVDPNSLAMRPEELRRRIEQDLADGATPTLVVATVGTTSTTAIDPVPRIGEICREHGVWLHVDAAYAGAAATCPEFRWTHAGVEYADSYCFNPHKWLLTGFDCDAFWVADRSELIQALSVLPEYLRNTATESGAVIDYRDWQVPLGRRMRALKLWFVMRWYGVEGLRRHIRHGVALAQEFAGLVADDERFEIVVAHPLSLVCFRLRTRPGESETAADARNAKLLRRLNATGRAYLTHTKVNDRYVLRLAVGAPATDSRHITATWRELSRIADEVAVD